MSLLCSEAVLGEELRIKNATEFLIFSQNVNRGNMYKRTTVFLDADLDFTGLSQYFEPIGRDSDNLFRGHFDGQGYMIKNLAIKSSSPNVGLFGYTEGTVIKNIVLDKSCSVLGTHTSEWYGDIIYVGSAVGYCRSIYWLCDIGNIINMANVVYNGDASKGENTYLGGITGYVFAHYYNSSVKNCVNYGNVAFSGADGHSTKIGGISGEFYSFGGPSPIFSIYIQNCLNYGNLYHTGPTQNLVQMGGIAAVFSGGYLGNSVNAGSIISGVQSTRIGAFVGFFYEATMENCYWSENTPYKYYGENIGSYAEECTAFSDDFKLNKTVLVGDTPREMLIDALDAYTDYSAQDLLSRCVLNRLGSTVSFSVNGQKRLSLDSKIILFPNIADDELKRFDGW